MQGTLALDLFRPAILDPVEVPEDDDLRAGERDVALRLVDAAPIHGGERRFAHATAASGGLTLDDLVVGVWEGLSAHRTVACPACGEAMSPRYGAGSAPVGGRCGGCRTTIV